ncbi:MAG TPA: hypothetical protein PK971_09810 [Saprospiraceae bacterium]|nr:hypothetical protein [Saprospiraceae bacterium]HND88615.1 hypothetical protein [Saprospiraceae bacterium]HNG89657.1 hypothetical protein [Saprospiraceae bacterium]
MLKTILLTLLCGLFCGTSLLAQKKDGKTPTPAAPSSSTSAPVAGPSTVTSVTAADSVMVTIILKHQQDKNLPEIRRVLEAQGFWDMFPPAEARVVTWTIAAGLGHIVTLMMPAGAVRRLNLALENGAWGAFNTDIYLSYDYKAVWKEYMEKREEAKEDRN